MRIAIIDPGDFKCVATEGVGILRMKSMEKKDIDRLLKFLPNLVFLGFRFSGHAVSGSCLQGPPILSLLLELLPGVPIIGIGNWGSLDEAIEKYDLSGVESRERFEELFGEFLIKE